MAARNRAVEDVPAGAARRDAVADDLSRASHHAAWAHRHGSVAVSVNGRDLRLQPISRLLQRVVLRRWGSRAEVVGQRHLRHATRLDWPLLQSRLLGVDHRLLAGVYVAAADGATAG